MSNEPTDQAPQRLGNRHPSIVPYETLEAGDGELVVAVGNDQPWRTFFRVLGVDDLADNPRFATNRDRVATRGASANSRRTSACPPGGRLDRALD
jgi:crotonobetainyl-CoA:carnitine CoA-transferase CaiB-like acyl-CoA transferase